MQHLTFYKFITTLLLSFVLLSTACSDGNQQEMSSEVSTGKPAQPTQSASAEELGDVIARVEDQAITFSQVNIMLNSSAVVGLSIPALWTHEGVMVRLVLV